MEIQQWITEVEALLKSFLHRGLLYPINPGDNRIHKNIDTESLKQLESIRVLHPQFKQFYQACNGVTMADVHNGYFLHSLELIIRGIESGEPIRIDGPSGGEIVFFGSDGGGRRFATYTDDRAEILYLKEGRVEESTYYERPRQQQIEVVAKSFSEFLDRLLADLKAFIKDDPNWTYITDS